jgi:hypothetical protein
MSFPRLALLALGLPLLTGACAGAAVTAASYGADGVSYVDSGKSTTDHFVSMVSKKDCALWRAFRNERICREREDGKDPYKVDYATAERQPSEDGVSYAPPLRPATDAPAASWTADAYKPAATPASPPAPTVTATAAEPAPPVAETAAPPPPSPAPKAVAQKAAKKKKAHAKAVKKPSPGQVASAS